MSNLKPKCNEEFSLHGKVKFSLDGEGSLYDYMSYQYNYFALRNQEISEGIDSVLLRFTQNNYLGEDLILKNGNESYSVDNQDERFIWAVGNKKMTLDGRQSLAEQCIVTFDPDFNKMQANLICDLLWRMRFISHRIVLVHAACISKGGKAILMPAWKGMGKTVACLKLVKSGYDFLADDRCWLSATNEVFAYPRYVVIKDTNAHFFPEVTSFVTKMKYSIYHFSSKVKFIKRLRVFQKLKHIFIPAKYFYINDLYQDAETVSTAKLTNVLSISKRQHLREIRMEQAEQKQIAMAIYNIGNVEWNNPLLSIAAAHDLLFPNGPNWTDEILSLMAKEKIIIHTAIRDVSCQVLTSPSDEKLANWDDLPSKIVDL